MQRWIDSRYVSQVIEQKRHDNKHVRLLLEQVNYATIFLSM
jgi:hypothetical protein